MNATNSSEVSLIQLLARALSRKPREPQNKKAWFVGPYGPTLMDEDLLPLAAVAEMRDEAEAQQSHEPEFRWVLDASGMRMVIAIAHHEPNPDLALLEVLSHTHFHHPDEDAEI